LIKIGNEWAWKKEKFSDYTAHSKEELRKTLAESDKEYGLFDRKGFSVRSLTRFEEQ
jgi:hypothetical protein